MCVKSNRLEKSMLGQRNNFFIVFKETRSINNQ